MLKIREVDENNQFLELRYIWNNLLNKSRDNNPFLTWEYLSTYWRHFSRDRELKIICIENEKHETVAIAPFRLSRYKFANLFTYNVMEPLGYRGADYTGLIIPEQEVESLKLIVNYLAEQNYWDFIYLFDIPEVSTASLLVNSSKNLVMPFEVYKGPVCPYIIIPRSLENVLKTLKSKFRKNIRRCLKNLEKDYKVELVDFKRFNSIEDAMNKFFDLHQQRWSLKNFPGVFSTEEAKDFFLDIAKIFAMKGWLALYFLMVDDQPVAAQLCYEYSQKMYYVLGGFDPNFSRYSVGNLITLKILEKCIEKSLKEYDFLKGGESYKFDWTDTYRTNLGFRFVNKKKTISKIYDFGIKVAKKTKADKMLEKFLRF